jgi:hypothetical protein
MPFIDSLDIANRVCQLIGVEQIFSPTEDSQRALEIANAYDKLRDTELRRNVWRFAVRKAVLRAIDTTTLLIAPSAYDATKTYLPGDVVQDTNGQLWISEIADSVNNAPGGNNEAWDMYFGPRTASLYDSTQAYDAGELVYIVTGTTPNGYQVYLSLISSNSDAPNVATAWAATTQYKQDDVVSNGGSQWRSLLPVNLNNTPADGHLAWASGSTYASGDQVTGSDNYIYTSVGNGNIGHDPTTDAGVHWTNTGTLNAWSRSPTLLAASTNWRPLNATLKNITTIYPLGAGPSSQSMTRNVFRLPAGYLRKAPQNPKVPTAALGGPRGYQYDDWEMDGNYIVSDSCDPITLRFVADITKVSAMDPMFCEGLACRIATGVCARLTQSEAKLASIASAYKRFMDEARTVNAIEEGYEDPPDDEYITVRY